MADRVASDAAGKVYGCVAAGNGAGVAEAGEAITGKGGTAPAGDFLACLTICLICSRLSTGI